MKFCSRIVTLVLTLGACAAPLTAQEIALKGGVTVSRFQSTGPSQPTGPLSFDGSFISTAFGGHARFHVGRIALQPELQMVSRGAVASESTLDERMRLDYMEVPLMLVIPVAIGGFEPYAFGGPMIAVETRCRSVIEQDNLKTNLDCEDPAAQNSFERRVLDYGASAGAGISYRLGGGRILVEGRYTWGLRDIYDGEEEGVEIRNRSAVFSIGYALIPADM